MPRCSPAPRTAWSSASFISEEPVSLAVLASMCATVSPHKPMCDQRQVSTAPDRA